ncbi:MAG: hypothetical protein IJW49_11035 [Clostridia bacterium]|nr:hypothetical protein [Clostridia bacterium]
MIDNRKHSWRFMTVAIIFCVVCMIYLGRLFYTQISGRGDDYDTGTTVRTVKIQAVRGEIYDRNGNLLVSNRYSYDLVLTSATYPTLRSATDWNLAMCQLLEGLDRPAEAGENLHVEKWFPMTGGYPDYAYSAEATDGDSLIFYRLRRVLGDLDLEDTATAQELVDFYVEKYDLLAKNSNGERLLSDEEVDRLIRLYYDMDAQRFSVSYDASALCFYTTTASGYTLAENVNHAAMAYVQEGANPLASFYVNAKRVYNYPQYASHILGTVGPIYAEEWEYYNEQGYQMDAIVGKSGCEKVFESYLHGIDGEMELVLDASGRVVRSTVLQSPVAGKDVYLTIDIDLQMAAEQGLAENVQYITDRANGNDLLGAGCNAGAAVVLSPDDFSVLALASYPTYDLNYYNLLYSSLAADEARPLTNRAISGLYEPGSTYKLGVAVAALMEGSVDTDDTVNCTGRYDRYSPSYSPGCSTYPHSNYGTRLTLREAIADSCNVFFYEMGYRLGIDTMNRYMKGFGIGEDTGLELGGATGSLANPDNWPRDEVAGRTLQAAIGQADTQVSPIQLACYLGTLMESGTRYSAHLLYGVSDFGTGNMTVLSQKTVLAQNEIPSWVLDEIKDGMTMVVKDNNVVRTNLSDVTRAGITVGGKTGTAQNSTDTPNALFLCAAPIEEPELIISVVLEQGYGGSYASLTAARILECYYGIDP